jgi:hypothetical protein
MNFRTLYRLGAAGIVVTVLGFLRAGSPQPASTPSRARTLPPRGKILSQSVSLRISLQPAFVTGQELKLLCPTSVYRGECAAKSLDATSRMGISGTISRMDDGRFLVTYDLEVRFADNSGLTVVSASGSGLLTNGKPATLLTIAGKSVVMIVTASGDDNELARGTSGPTTQLKRNKNRG